MHPAICQHEPRAGRQPRRLGRGACWITGRRRPEPALPEHPTHPAPDASLPPHHPDGVPSALQQGTPCKPAASPRPSNLPAPRPPSGCRVLAPPLPCGTPPTHPLSDPFGVAPPRARPGRWNPETLNTEDAQRRARAAPQAPPLALAPGRSLTCACARPAAPARASRRVSRLRQSGRGLEAPENVPRPDLAGCSRERSGTRGAGRGDAVPHARRRRPPRGSSRSRSVAGWSSA